MAEEARSTRSFYTRGGLRRHAIKDRGTMAVRSFCGVTATVKDATFSTVEVNCDRCIRWTTVSRPSPGEDAQPPEGTAT